MKIAILGEVKLSIKLSRLSVCVITALTVLSGTQAVAKTADFGAYGEETALTLAREYAGRYTGSDKEVAAAQYMQERMTIAGSPNAAEIQAFSFVAPRGIFRGQTLNSNNVVVKQKGTTDKTLYVGGHYDSAVAYAGYDMLEALDDNASGAGVISELVRNLSGVEGEHNVEYIAFGAEEGGLNGSKAFAASLSDSDIANAIGMINLDSLITGDKMYANAGDNAYDADGNEVAANVGLRENALRIAKSMGIDLQINQGLIPDGETEPYKPEGVGCCSDQESFDNLMQVVGFEATDWSAGDELDGYTQTSNPAIPNGYTWHNPELDNEETLINAFGAERISDRMRDFSRIITRLIIEQTNADIVASNKTAIALQNNMGKSLKNAAQASHDVIDERANAVALDNLNVEQPTKFWVDGSQSYVKTDDVEEGHRSELGLFAEHMVKPDWRIGAGVQLAKQDNSNTDNAVKGDDSVGVNVYSLAGNKSGKWYNTTNLSFTQHDLETQRDVVLTGGDGIDLLNNTERADVDADVLAVRNELGYNFITGEKATHGAFLGLDYSNVDIDSYQSGNNDSRTALKVDGTKSDNFEAEVGYQAQYNFIVKDMPTKLAAKLSYVNVLEGGYVNKLSTVSLADNQSRLVSVDGDNDDDFGRVSLGINTAVRENVNAYLNGEATFGHDDKDQAIKVGLQYQF